MRPHESRSGLLHRVCCASLLCTVACGDATVADPVPRPVSVLVDSTLALYSSVVPVPPLPPSDALSGGETTVFDTTASAFSFAAPNLSATEVVAHEAGDAAFEEAFVPRPGLGGGLGPLFDNSSCESCHEGDGRGTLPAPGQPLTSMLLRLSIPGVAPDGSPLAAPGFGGQLQPMSIPGVRPEASVLVSHHFVFGRYGDGTTFKLRQPSFLLFDPYTALPASLMMSPRVAPANFGLGLLEAIPEATIRALADEFDRNHDGISGRANVAYDAINSAPALGRFGLKSNTPGLVQQSAGAYNGDMGITTPVFPAENCEAYLPIAECAPHAPEVNDSVLAAVAFYVRTLGVPARRRINDPQVRLGEAIFTAIGCANCHIPTLQTGVLAGVPAVSNQLIRPYTDLLVHDMGAGLSDNRPDFLASGREWRTTPLWGIGLTKVVNPSVGFLHDGRARDLSEAILWHGGEAQTSREIFRLLPRTLRATLITFLNSL